MSMKGGKDKAMRPEQGKQKGAAGAGGVPPPAALAAGFPPVLICNSACNIPGVGTWAHGEVVRDQAIIGKILGSPNFDKIEEVE